MRSKVIFGSTVLAAAALYVVSSDFGSHRSSSVDESARTEAKGIEAATAVDEKPNDPPIEMTVPQLNDYGVAAGGESSGASDRPVDEDPTRPFVKEQAIEDISTLYSRLLDDIDLTMKEKDALVALLVEDQIASTSTPYSQGKAIDRKGRNSRISAIIGDKKLRQFLAREADLGAYSEVERINTVLRQNGVPLTETQRDRLFELLADLGDRIETTLPSDVERNSIESLEYQLAAMNERERFVIEQAPSVLSSEQVVLLDQMYQYASYQRADALNRQKDQRATNPDEDVPISYPGRQ